MDRRHSTPLKAALRLASILLVTALSLLSASRTTARPSSRVTNLHVGLVHAYEASQAAYDSNAGWELVYFRWDQLQPGGPADWAPSGPTGEWLDSAHASGREVVGVLIGTPAWATDDMPGTGVPRGLYLPVNDPGNAWAAFVRRAVSYFAARGVNRWVIWEELDIPPGIRGAQWDGTTADYYQLVKVAYLAAKEANPNARIHLGGIGTFDPTWFDRFLDVVIDDPTAPANDYYFDVATVHVFFSPDSVYTLAANPFYLMEKAGMPLKPVWVNKTNARPAVDPDAYPPDTTFKSFIHVTLEQQAAFTIQAYALGFAAGVERIATYRLVDNLAGDDTQAFGLLRTDGSARPAYTAYQIAAQEFNGFVYARRVDEEAHPLIEYVRLTFPQKVTHIVWARTEKTATLVIPARSAQATLIDMHNNRWLVTPQGGEYRVVAGGADCNEPSAPSGCMIGGVPWLLVEEGIEDALGETPPPVEVEEGGTLPTPDPGMALTATAQAVPTATPTSTPTLTPTPTVPPTEVIVEPSPQATQAPTTPPQPTGSPVEEAAPPTSPPPTEIPPTEPPPTGLPPTPTPIDGRPGQPRGVAAILPFLMIGLGVLVIAGGVVYFVNNRPADAQVEEWEEEPAEEWEEPVEEWEEPVEDENGDESAGEGDEPPPDEDEG